MGAANERRRYTVTSSFNGLAHIQYDPCVSDVMNYLCVMRRKRFPHCRPFVLGFSSQRVSIAEILRFLYSLIPQILWTKRWGCRWFQTPYGLCGVFLIRSIVFIMTLIFKWYFKHMENVVSYCTLSCFHFSPSNQQEPIWYVVKLTHCGLVGKGMC